MTRKRFVKLAMSMGYSKRWADGVCRHMLKQRDFINEAYRSLGRTNRWFITWSVVFNSLVNSRNYFGYAHEFPLANLRIGAVSK